MGFRSLVEYWPKMNFTKIKTFKGLDYGRTQKPDNILKQVFGDFYNTPSVPSTNLIQDIENTSGFSRVPLSGVNRTADRKTSFNRSTILFIGITGLVLFYLVAK